MSDWFGQNFVDLISFFIINTATIAEQKGYKVSYQEARFDLIKNAKEGLSKKLKTPLKSDNDYYRYALALLGMKEKTAVNVWKKILLFRKYMQEVGGSVFLDTLCLDEITSYAHEKVKIELFELPSYLRLKNFYN